MQFRSAQILAAVIAAFTLAACQMNVAMYEGADAGYAVASIAMEPDSYYLNVQHDFRGSDGKNDSYLFWINDDQAVLSPPADFRSAAEKGGVATVRMRPGQYELYSFGVKSPAKGYTPRFIYSIPFTVEAGKVTYLGQYLTLGHPEEGSFGTTILGEPYFVISNQQARDMAIAAKKTPALAGLPVTNSVPDPAALRLPYFRATPIPTRN